MPDTTMFTTVSAAAAIAADVAVVNAHPSLAVARRQRSRFQSCFHDEVTYPLDYYFIVIGRKRRTVL